MATKKALLIGINNYRYISDLRGCISDVEKFERLLHDRYGFPQQNIHKLIDEDAIKSNVMDELEWLLKGAKAGDQLVFMTAGHGTQVADTDGDEADGVDEVYCLYDMDFDDPDSYLIDDDIYRFTRRLNEGAKLTILFDCCHSGTATRMLLAPGNERGIEPNKAPLVDLRTTLARTSDRAISRALSMREEGQEVLERLLEPRTKEEQQQVVLARFIEPPPKVLELASRKGVRRRLSRSSGGKGSRQQAKPMNHVFFAAAESRQTAADAFIDGAPHGAFSYYFCRAVEEGGGADMQQLIRQVRAALARERFSQVPQLEPETASGPLFGAEGQASAASPSKGGAAEPAKDRPGKTSAEAAADDSLSEATGQRIFELLTEIRDLMAAQGRRAEERLAPGDRALVYVHGICEHKAGYSDPWWEALRPHLSHSLRNHLETRRHEVLWSHHVTRPRALPREAVPESMIREFEQREQELAEYLRDVVEDRAQRAALADLPAQERGVRAVVEPPLSRGAIASGLDCVDDFAKYLMRTTVRREVQREFLDVVRPLLEQGVDVDVMAHSWGTVVAYEALRTLDRRELPGRILNLFTIGSALAIVPVQRRLETGDFVRPWHVRRWINLDAHLDFVGGSLLALDYGVDDEYLNLEPVGCTFFRRTPWCAHASYFRPENTAVNRDIFAVHMAR